MAATNYAHNTSTWHLKATDKSESDPDPSLGGLTHIQNYEMGCLSHEVQKWIEVDELHLEMKQMASPMKPIWG